MGQGTAVIPDWCKPSHRNDLQVCPKLEKHGTAEKNMGHPRDLVPEWVNIVFGWSEAESVRCYAVVELILARFDNEDDGERCAIQWILDGSKEFLNISQNTFDV
jgi:hypothetical protein